MNEPLNDGSTIEVSEKGTGLWDLTLPSGQHIRGKAADQAQARAAAHREHDAYVLRQWERGCPIAGGVFHVPLR